VNGTVTEKNIAYSYLEPKSPSQHTTLRAGRPEFDSQQGQECFFATESKLVLGPTQPPIQWVRMAHSPGCEADHSYPPSAEVTNAWGYTSTYPYIFMARCTAVKTNGAVAKAHMKLHCAKLPHILHSKSIT
jgi:hypothetical protein